MVFPIILGLGLLVVVFSAVLASKAKTHYERGTWYDLMGFSIIGTFIAFVVGTLFVSIGAEQYPETANYGEVQELKRVIPGEDEYIFETVDGDIVVVYSSDIIFENPTETPTIQYGPDVISWGHWLPFGDWESATVVKYAPAK